MSFPGSFSSQLSAIMEALLKAVVAEVTALVEDGAVELRLELRDRDRQILDKEREIEERDRVIEELRAAVEELTAREEDMEEEEEAVSPAEDTQEDDAEKDWTKEEEDTKPVVKSELTEEFTAASSEPHGSQWIPHPPTTSTATGDTAVSGSFDTDHEMAQNYPQYSQESENLFHANQADLPVDTFLNSDEEQFYATQPGFSLIPDLCQAQDGLRNKSAKKKTLNENGQNCGSYKCHQCGKTFKTKCRLVTHQSVHTGVKLYSCERCGKRFSRTDSLARHMRNANICCNDPPGMSY